MAEVTRRGFLGMIAAAAASAVIPIPTSILAAEEPLRLRFIGGPGCWNALIVDQWGGVSAMSNSNATREEAAAAILHPDALKQDSAARRPRFVEDGGRPYIQFDEADDHFLSTRLYGAQVQDHQP